MIKSENTEKRNYITHMPDKSGAFLVAGKIIANHGGNITRVNYNKAVDTHTLFIEVQGSADAHEKIQKELEECGYLPKAEAEKEQKIPQIMMIVLTLRDEPGSVKPVLEILDSHKVNISYISSQENGSGFQSFKMGLFIENTGEIKALIEEISKICEIKILDYEVTDRLLDGTVFYVSFANEMRKILNLNQNQTNEVLVYANQMMQILDEQKKSPLKTFDYIRRFASLVVSRKGESFKPDISFMTLKNGITLFIIEPPCGSNTYILARTGDSNTADSLNNSGSSSSKNDYSASSGNTELLFIDSGFACYREEMLELLRGLFPNFDSMKKTGIITHADQDHAGLLDLFEKTYMSAGCYENFRLEKEGKLNFREQIPLHKPYCNLSKIISGYKTPDLEKCIPFKERSFERTNTAAPELFEKVGTQNFFDLDFNFYEGLGGHVRGDTIIECPELKLLFSGDIYVNIRGFSNEQKEFNALAPFLMTGVDSDSEIARKSREYLLLNYSDYIICPGHGAVKT